MVVDPPFCCSLHERFVDLKLKDLIDLWLHYDDDFLILIWNLINNVVCGKLEC